MSRSVRVNPIACEAHGLCGELFPEWIMFDDWGYPIVDPGPVPKRLQKHARRAVAACPTLALLLVEERKAASRRAQDGAAGEERDGDR